MPIPTSTYFVPCQCTKEVAMTKATVARSKISRP